MYAAHFAAGLAIKTRAPKAPVWALLTGAFLPDLLWIGFAANGVEPTDPKVFFDDWSHSLASIIIQATLFAFVFYRRGTAVWLPVWIAVFSHFILDFPIHPRPLALCPYSSLHLGWNLWQWGLSKSAMGVSNYWLIQLVVTLVLLAFYVSGVRRITLPWNLAAATCMTVIALHLVA